MQEILYSVSEVIDGKMTTFIRGKKYDLEKEGVPKERLEKWIRGGIVKKASK